MSESKMHRVLKHKFAGKTGDTECPLPSRRKVDSKSGTGIVTEIELDGAPGRRAAISRLREAQRIGIARKVRMVVQNQNLDSAYNEMRRQRVGGEVISTDGTTKIYVPKRRKSTKPLGQV